MEKYLLVFLGGGLGAMARYGLSGLIHRYSGAEFPLGTMIINILGSIMIGLVMSMSERYMAITPNIRVFLTIGIMGGFTTFSSFSYETMALLQGGQLVAASVNVAGSVVCCIAGAWAGILLGRII
ncbi:MAG: fluoride efflux transporter CrcB [Nitrospirae bacterium]|jgi:CrcB protein|nr:fluoride efflux transporter CrcB [Nitrospirota bacterium]